jgi:hydroxyacylglutathione hydrolase
MFTGDSVYPGRLYIRDLDAFQKSNARMLHFTDGKILADTLGNHIEQTRTPYLDYPVGTAFQLSRGVLLEIQAGLEGMHGKPQRITYRDFSLWPSGP